SARFWWKSHGDIVRVLKSQLVAAAGALTMLVANANAQRSSADSLPTRVRVTLTSSDRQKVTGALLAHESDSVVLQTRAGTRTIRLNEIRSVELSRGVRGRAARGALIGGITGIAVGALYGVHLAKSARGVKCTVYACGSHGDLPGQPIVTIDLVD